MAEAAILVKEIDEVFEAKMASGRQSVASWEKICCLIDNFSATAYKFQTNGKPTDEWKMT